MGLFLKRLSFFTIPIALLVFGIEYSIRTIPNSYRLKTEYLNKNANILEVLILGSSHTFYGLNPKYFDFNTFNASNVSQSIDVDYAALKAYESDLQQLKFVVIRLSYDTLFETLKGSTEDWRFKNYKLYTPYKLDYSFRHNFELLNSDFKTNLKSIKNYYFKDIDFINCNALGWGTDANSSLLKDLEKTGNKVALKHTAEDFRFLQENIKELSKLIEFCKEKSVKVILVTPPAYKSYSHHLNQAQLDKMILVGNQMDKLYQNCSYYNFLSAPQFGAVDFFDADHLNEIGAKKFSYLVNQIISQ